MKKNESRKRGVRGKKGKKKSGMWKARKKKGRKAEFAFSHLEQIPCFNIVIMAAGGIGRSGGMVDRDLSQSNTLL